MSTPQLILSLTPSGTLIIELPGPMSTRRKVEVREDDLATTARRILEAQQAAAVEIGLDGAPTQAQVRHWERHGIWADERCPFCLREGRIGGSERVRRIVTLAKRDDGVEVRKIPARQKGAPAPIMAKKNLSEMGI